ncbi:protein ACCELERATED CELL DEATH 6-like [Neltuma alba]|uniref:protein ACCELERATED CELL DEATH 6-like n=1 Tax=Neltuma alba TaxID=207710 RepID=UPI0010A3C72F|nr:protein ACCELERATED CELL DEATH 6-like [Prosopis alba]
MAESTEYIDEEETPMEPCMWLPEPEMQAAVLSREMEISSSILNHKLSEQEHGPNTDLNLLTAAYVSMDSSVSPSHGDFIVPDPAIYKQRTPLENTVLHLAAAYGKNAMVDNIAQQAPCLFTVTNSNYDTALHAAARAGHASTIRNLLNSWLPFIRRETDGHKDQFTLQMMLLVSLTLLRNKQGNTFFHEAFMVNAQNGDKIFRAFQDSFITNGLEMEAEFKKIVNHLAVFAINKEGKSLLYVASEVGCKQVVDQLLDICIEYDVKPQGKSPFLPALAERDMDMLQTILIKKPNWIHLRNEEGRLALHEAASIGYHEAVSCLVKKCSSCTIERDNNGYFPIHLACIKGHVKVVEKLLKYYQDPTELLDKNGRTLLHVAAKSGKYELVRYILQHPKHEIMINQTDNDGNTPLHLATLHYHPKIVHSLTWDSRVNLTVLNQEDQTALDIAELRHGKNPSIAQVLTWIALQSASTPRSSAGPVLSNDTLIYGEERESASTKKYKDRLDTLILVSTLIITASFAAEFAMPGGVDKGTAVMLNHGMFHLFILSLTISVFGAIITTIILLWARLDDLRLMLFALKCAMPVLGISLTTLSLAFLAGVYLVVNKLSWLATTFLVLSVVLAFMVVFLYALLWLPSSSTIPFVRYISYYPFLLLAKIVEGKTDANHKGSRPSSTL